MAEVQVIPPKAARPDTLRVAAYCRVSSDSADQLHSYAAQIRAYTQAINAHDGWDLVDIYADEGLTGTRMDKREDFNRLMADCRKGKIDKIVVKSISRFARNTRDCLATLRELSSLGVTVKFEKENIDTGTLTSELMVSVSASLAQEESISISKNQRMSYQRRMERGEFITCSAPFGYQIVDGKNLTIVEDQAEIVKWIFAAYLRGSIAHDHPGDGCSGAATNDHSAERAARAASADVSGQSPHAPADSAAASHARREERIHLPRFDEKARPLYAASSRTFSHI